MINVEDYCWTLPDGKRNNNEISTFGADYYSLFPRTMNRRTDNSAIWHSEVKYHQNKMLSDRYMPYLFRTTRSSPRRSLRAHNGHWERTKTSHRFKTLKPFCCVAHDFFRGLGVHFFLVSTTFLLHRLRTKSTRIGVLYLFLACCDRGTVPFLA